MKKEIEMLFYDLSITDLKMKIIEIGGKLEREEFFQKRVVYNFGEKAGESTWSWLRLRDEAGKVKLTFKQTSKIDWPKEL